MFYVYKFVQRPYFPLSAAMSSLQYERLCVLFNIGVLQGQIAAAQNFQTDEGLKTAAKMFQVNTSHLSLFIPRNILLTMGQDTCKYWQ